MNPFQKSLLTLLVVCFSAIALAAMAASDKPAPPYINLHLAQSAYPSTHIRSNFTPLAGPTGPSRRLNADEIQWKSVGPANIWAPMYSGSYPDGRKVIWTGGYDRITKLDAETLEVLTNYAIGGNTYFGDEEINRYITTIDKLKGQEFIDYNLDIWDVPFKSVESFYRVLTKDNRLIMSHRGADGLISIQVFAEADASNPASPIQLVREWKIPSEISQASIFSMSMTPDGWVVAAMSDGVLVAVKQDLSEHVSLVLPQQHSDEKIQDVFTTFVRNGVTIDDQGGVYVVTRDLMHRVQWTGKELSLKPEDGAWSSPYPNETGKGSGTTPGLMGWGADEDHLIVIADGSQGNNLVVFWRDNIPEDWQGLPGHDRRIAGITPITFGVSDSEQVQVENTPVIYGYGAFVDNTYPVKHLPDQGAPAKQWLAEVMYAAVPGHELRGGSMIQWDESTRKLKTAWNNQQNFAASVCTVSGATELLYCWGVRDQEWTFEGIDWHSGESAFHYTLGKSNRFNTMAGSIIVAPNGAIDCGCQGGMGLIRLRPTQ